MPHRKTGLSLLLLPVALIAGCSSGFVPTGKEGVPKSSAPTATTSGQVRSNGEGAVTVDIEWLGVQNGSAVFNVSMDTHSVNLDQYDLKEMTVLRDSSGKTYRPTSWDSQAGGHHRAGTLTFATDSVTGKTGYFELIVRDIASVKERAFRWELKS